MKKLTLLPILLATVCTALSQSAALDFGSGSQVRNSIIFENRSVPAVSSGVSVRFSASDAALPTGNENVHLPVTPFSSDFRINMGSLAFDRGSSTYLNAWDTLDLDFNPRVSCQDLDIGAFEHHILPTQITVQPTLAGRVCEGANVLLEVQATGQGITFQWQRNGVNLVGRTSSILALPNVSIADTGYYRVIVFGACCNDTSDLVRVNVDLRPVVVARDDVEITAGDNVTLYTVSSTGTVFWFESDFETAVLNLNLTNITDNKHFYAVATNGVCPDTAVATVFITIVGAPCMVRTYDDVTVCPGEPHRLLIRDASVTARWFLAGTGMEIPNTSLVRPSETSQFVLVGFNENDEVCARDTLVITVPQINFTVRDDARVCIGSEVQFYSTPQADWWFDQNNNPLQAGNFSFTPPPGQTSIFIAQFTDPATNCTVRDTVSIFVNPPDLSLPFANLVEPGEYHLTVCEGDLVHLQTNIDPIFVDWRNAANQSQATDPTITATQSTTFRAWAWDAICGDIYVNLTLTVQPLPAFEVIAQEPVFAGTSVNLGSIPNTPIWTDMDGTRVFPPLELHQTQSFIGVFVYGTCQITDTLTIEVAGDRPPPPPAMQVTFSTTIASNRDCDNGTMTVTVTGGVPPYDFEWTRVGSDGSYTWYDFNNPTGQLQQFNVVAGTYSFIVFDSEGEHIEFQIPVPCEHEQPMPSILVTPNGDGKNDYLWIENIEFFPINTVTIINSYGAEIVRIQNFNNQDVVWRGQDSRGRYVPDGTYWYVVEAQGVQPMVGWIIVRLSPGR